MYLYIIQFDKSGNKITLSTISLDFYFKKVQTAVVQIDAYNKDHI